MGTAIHRYTELGHRITEMLETASKQQELATALDINQSVVSKKLLGKVAITVDDLVKIARHLNVPVAAFFEKRGTDGGVLRAFHEMHLRAPDALDQIINAYRHNRRLLRVLGKIAQKLVAHTEPEIRRGERILSAGVANSGVALPAPFDLKEEKPHDSEDVDQSHHGGGSDERGDP